MRTEMFAAMDAVCFDVDSTIIREESLNELAEYCGKGPEVRSLTRQATNGSISHRDALRIRLSLLRPSVAQVTDFLRKRPPTLTPGVQSLVNALHERHVPVYLISGGFRDIISPIAKQLSIPRDHVFANRLQFYFDGEFAGIDEDEPIYRTGSKAPIIEELKEKFGYDNLWLIGDGETELEACPPADVFIGFGGNVVRPVVKERADWFVTDFNDILRVVASNQPIIYN